jgi:hypothetical protein
MYPLPLRKPNKRVDFKCSANILMSNKVNVVVSILAYIYFPESQQLLESFDC